LHPALGKICSMLTTLTAETHVEENLQEETEWGLKTTKGARAL
jgi:hypothetical protein